MVKFKDVLDEEIKRYKPLRVTVTGNLDEVDMKIMDHIKRGNRLIKRGLLPRNHGNTYNYPTGNGNKTRTELGTDSIAKHYAIIELRCRK